MIGYKVHNFFQNFYLAAVNTWGWIDKENHI